MGNEWKIYDVVAEDISLVNNYRSQFNRVITRSSYEEGVGSLYVKYTQHVDRIIQRGNSRQPIFLRE